MFRKLMPMLTLCAVLAACNDSDKEKGTEGGPCLDDHTCRSGLTCSASNICVKQSASDGSTTTHDGQTTTHDGQTTTHDGQVTSHDGPATTHDGPATTHDGPATTHDGPATTYDSGGCTPSQTEKTNCGQCGNNCDVDEECVSGTCRFACAKGTADVQIFTKGMYGCAGTVTYADRATLCGTGFHVCSAVEWMERKGSPGSPSFMFWTNDNLGYGGTAEACWAQVGGTSCGTQPMRICTLTGTDPKGNTCNWHGCGYDTATPNQYFGGCYDDADAGTLCCK